MKKFLTAMALLACTAALAVAGPNAGGTILVHYNPGITPPPEPAFVDGGLTACADAITEAPLGADPIMWFAYAAFPQAASPRVKVVSFGCDYDTGLTGILWYATQPGATEIFYPDQSAWPMPGSGVAIGFENTLTATVDEIYCFCGYSYGGFFTLVAHPDPNLGGTFADDNVPSQVDQIAGYGSLGFGQPGVPACPVEPAPGACCYNDGRCEFVIAQNCAGTFLGEGIACDPNPCPPAGACCLGTECVILTQEACVAQSGTFYGGDCTPTLCNPSPAENTSWGQIKNNYR